MQRRSWLLAALLVWSPLPIEGDQKQLADEIRAAALGTGSPGRPLPLAAHWNTGTKPDGFGPAYQLELLSKGFHILPWMAAPVPGEKNPPIDYYRELLRWSDQNQIPVGFLSTQWERILSVDPGFLALSAKENPNVIRADRSVERRVSPVGGSAAWNDAGRRWGRQPLWREIQEIYPDPPLVILLSNNEHAKLRWKDAYQDARFADQHGANLPAEQVREAFAADWKEKYGQLFQGMRESFAAPAWQQHSRMVGYNAFLPAATGRWPGWVEHALTTQNSLSAWTNIWQGACLPFYTHHWDSSTDCRVWSPQVEAMNWRAAAETLSDDPPFWIELSTWDGNRGKPDDKRGLYTQMGQTYGPERYEGMVQFGLWLVQPRIVREFRGHSERRSDYEPYFRAVLRGVERIHRDPDLRRFWEQGKLVVASHREHPYQTDLPGGWGARGRWFLLRTSVDPSEPWKLDTPLTVFALAHGMGEKPHRRWLIYAHAPAGLARQVTINIPDFSGLQVDVPPRGAFWVVEESPANVRALDPDPGPR